MSADNFNCVASARVIEPWIARRPGFQCPECSQHYRSNYRRLLYLSPLVGFCSWLAISLVAGAVTGAWARVLLVSIEFGLFWIIAVSWLAQRWLVRIEPT